MDLSPTRLRNLGLPPEKAFALALLLAFAFLVVMLFIARRTLGFQAKRILIKLTFKDAAKACQLVNVTREMRYVEGKAVPQQKEHFPSLCFFGKALPGKAGVVWKARPAQGMTVDDLAKAHERLARSLRVHQILIERKKPYEAEMTIIFYDSLAETITRTE